MKKRIFNRFISLLCSIVTVANLFVPFLGSVSYAETTEDFIGSQILLVDKGKCGSYLTYDETEIKARRVLEKLGLHPIETPLF